MIQVKTFDVKVGYGMTFKTLWYGYKQCFYNDARSKLIACFLTYIVFCLSFKILDFNMFSILTGSFVYFLLSPLIDSIMKLKQNYVKYLMETDFYFVLGAIATYQMNNHQDEKSKCEKAIKDLLSYRLSGVIDKKIYKDEIKLSVSRDNNGVITIDSKNDLTSVLLGLDNDIVVSNHE